VTSVYELAGAAWDDDLDPVDERCLRCGHDLAVHDPGVGCDECSCVYGVDGWALDAAAGEVR
jgi:hypothetical protein